MRKFLQNFISSRDGPIKIQKLGRDVSTPEDYPHYYGLMAEMKDNKTALLAAGVGQYYCFLFHHRSVVG